MLYKPEYRLAKQNSTCRVCGKINIKDEDMILHVHSIINSGNTVIICSKCIDKIYNMKLEYEKNK